MNFCALNENVTNESEKTIALEKDTNDKNIDEMLDLKSKLNEYLTNNINELEASIKEIKKVRESFEEIKRDSFSNIQKVEKNNSKNNFLPNFVKVVNIAKNIVYPIVRKVIRKLII